VRGHYTVRGGRAVNHSKINAGIAGLAELNGTEVTESRINTEITGITETNRG